MKIYAISGLGADKRVFNYLTLKYKLISIEWIKPNHKESIIDYSKRLIKKYNIDKQADFGILGVSFGGLIATEISKLTKPKFTISISSIETHTELNMSLKVLGKLKLLQLIPKKFFSIPKPIAHFMFGAQNKELLNAILDDTDIDFIKWALIELVNWKNQTRLQNLIKIGGSQDKLLASKGKNTLLVENGEHFMIVDKAIEISQIINKQIDQLNT